MSDSDDSKPRKRLSESQIYIDRASIIGAMVKRGELVTCPACGIGHVFPPIAELVRAALPPVRREAPTSPDPIVDDDTPAEGLGEVPK